MSNDVQQMAVREAKRFVWANTFHRVREARFYVHYSCGRRYERVQQAIALLRRQGLIVEQAAGWFSFAEAA